MFPAFTELQSAGNTARNGQNAGAFSPGNAWWAQAAKTGEPGVGGNFTGAECMGGGYQWWLPGEDRTREKISTHQY